MRQFLAVFTFIFTFTQAFAYGPVEAPTTFEADHSLTRLSQPMSEKKFERVKRRALRKNARKIKKVKDLSAQEQTEYVVAKLEKKNEKAVRTAKRIKNSPKKLAKYKRAMRAKLPTITDNEIEASLDDIIEGRALVELKADLMSKIEKAGSYLKLLENQRVEIQNLERVAKASEKLSEVKSTGNEAVDIVLVLIGIIVVAFLLCLIWAVVTIIKGVVAIAAGAVVPGLVLVLCGSYLLLDLLVLDY